MISRKISVALIHNGFLVTVDSKIYKMIYPYRIWKNFSKELHLEFTHSVAVFLTYHLCFSSKVILDYQFPSPLLLPFIVHGFLDTLPEALLEFPKAHFSKESLWELLYKSTFNLRFTSEKTTILTHRSHPINARSAMLPFSFGKDSLLTYALCTELGLKPRLIFFQEPTSKSETDNKLQLSQKFTKEFGVSITFFPVDLGRLRQTSGYLWGWDLLCTQYTFLLLPFIFSERAHYLFWSSEQNVNQKIHKHNIPIQINYELGNRWLLQLNNLLRLFHSNTEIGSIIEPIYELNSLYILHHRYPQIAKYQLTCDNESKTFKKKRWCGHCTECARMYLYMKALNVSPESIDLKENMFHASKKKYFPILNEIHPKSTLSYQYHQDRLLAFYLAYKRGIKGELINLFVKLYLPQVEKQKQHLVNEFSTIHPYSTIPALLKKRLETIFT